VAIAYAVVAWILIQIAAVTFPALNLPEWTVPLVILLVALGFPLAVVFAWAYELTPEGIKPTHHVDSNQSITASTGGKFDFAIIGLLVIALGYFVYHHEWGEREARPTAAQEPAATPSRSTSPMRTELQSIAVLPFVNMSADPEQEYFSDGIAEEILNALVRVPDLRVAARTSSFYFKGEKVDIQAVGEKLKVNHVLEGSVRKAGNRLRITAQLIKVDDGFHLWSESYDRELNDIFAIQEQIAQSVVKKLEVALGFAAEEPLVKTGTTNTEAYNWYLRGRYEIERQTPERFQKAIESFSKAIELDPDFAGGHGGLAYVSAYKSAFQPYRLLADQVRAAYTRALAIDENQVEALLAKAWDLHFTNYDFGTGEPLVKRALSVATDKALVLDMYLFHYLHPQRRFDEALQIAAAAEREDPLSPLVKQGLAVSLLWKGGRDEEVIEKFDETLELNPQDFYSLWMQRKAYIRLGRFAEAQVTLDKMEAIIGRDNGFWLEGHAHLQLARGDHEAAEADRQEMVALYESDEVSLFAMATFIGNVTASLGLLDEAMAWFEGAYEDREFWSVLIPVFNLDNPALWKHPDFQPFLEKMNLDDASIAALQTAK